MSFLLATARRSASAAGPSSLVARSFSTTRPAQVARMTLVGRLGTDPELIETGKVPRITYSVGVGHGPKDNRQTSWFRVASFATEGTARDITMGLTKGTLIYLEGDATMSVYEDSNGKKQSGLNLVQTKVEVLKRPQQPRDGDQADSAAV